MKTALPVILVSVGALMAIGVPAAAIFRNIHMRTAGRLAADSDLALLAWTSMFAVPLGLLLMIAGLIIRRARKSEQEAAAQRRARREAARSSRLTERPD